MKKRKIGLYGGTFNPPHLGHIGAAEAFCREARLDELIIMPDFLPPHKEVAAGVSPEDRLNMSHLAFKHINGATVSDLEIKRGGRSYTSVTLEELYSEETEIYFLCGTDMILTMSEWYRPEKIFELATICYVRRETDEETTKLIEARIREYELKFSARVIKIPLDVIEISSTSLRELIKRGDAGEYLSEDVYNYILQRGLYK